MQDKTSPRIRKLTQNSSFVQYYKNLMQSNGQSRNLEIPIDGYYGEVASPYIRTDCPQPKQQPGKNHASDCLNCYLKTFTTETSCCKITTITIKHTFFCNFAVSLSSGSVQWTSAESDETSRKCQKGVPFIYMNLYETVS